MQVIVVVGEWESAKALQLLQGGLVHARVRVRNLRTRLLRLSATPRLAQARTEGHSARQLRTLPRDLKPL